MRAAELRAFLVHLRVHYQLLILSGGYLLGGLYNRELALQPFLLQLLNVHVLLNGGVTAYNSFWDDDDGPIGGVEHPPKMRPWMHHAALALQALGLVLAIPRGATFVALWLITMALSVAYSRRGPRWKGHPWLSLAAVGVGTGTNTFWMGYLAGGGRALDPFMLAAGLGVAALLLSLYPVSQVFQMDEDRANGDHTFAATYGLAGVRRFFVVGYAVGLATVTATLHAVHPTVGIVFGGVGAAGAVLNGAQLWRLTGATSEYRAVMRLKYGASLSFVVFITACLVWVARSR
ncbi:MAG: UbiA prenyltransferase family protein [Myxococcales bacterium]|nr:UbiA prenyltransferase family protein [Myxococcales bacterium]MCB9650224.1 UbiA prenyltransferase family protein [Deltaproteobacteria bacterium]